LRVKIIAWSDGFVYLIRSRAMIIFVKIFFAVAAIKNNPEY
jgi:hypothetical protein